MLKFREILGWIFGFGLSVIKYLDLLGYSVRPALLIPKIGRGDAKIVDPSVANKCIWKRWKPIKTNLYELAKLRWIENWKTPDLCARFGKKRSAIRQDIRSLRHSRCYGLELTDEERILILKKMREEEKNLGMNVQD